MLLRVVFIALPAAAQAFQLPFKLPFFTPSSPEVPLSASEAPSGNGTQRVAIIGAGAAGTSAAFWIAKARERYGIDVHVDVYERSSYVGGRSTVVYPYDDRSLDPMELGASIFVGANRNLMRAVQEFNLSTVDFEDPEASTGIWDGRSFVTTMAGSGFAKYWDTLRVLWRYGFVSPKRTEALVQKMVEQYRTLYSRNPPHWASISDVSVALGYNEAVSQTTAQYLEKEGISKLFVGEIVEAGTRVNYGQNIDEIHGLEGMVSLAASGASGVVGGNFQIFEGFLARSEARLFLNTTVVRLRKKSVSGSPATWALTTSDHRTTTYDTVILAAPAHTTGLGLEEIERPYVRLHVTLLSTTSTHPNPEYFGWSANSQPPTTILTTYDGVRERGTPEPEFNSLTYHGTRTRNGVTEHLVKIFSKARISDEWLQNVFGHVGWVHRKEWDAYPRLPPTETFPPIRLDDGFWYVNAFEMLISTMDTETIAARGVVDLWLKETYGHGICPEESEKTDEDDGFVWGWEC